MVRPYVEEEDIRIFSKDVDPMSLIWHADSDTRTITVLEGKNWYLQMEGNLPFELTPAVSVTIESGVIHRVIRGTSDLKVTFI